MTTRTFNTDLDNLMTDAVDYFNTHYIAKYRKHKENVQSENETDKTIGNIHIYSHIDTDGLCAASILALALKRENISYHITILKQLEEKYIIDIASSIEENNEFLFFLDFGSGQLNLLSENIPNGRYIILDHHQPLRSTEDFKLSGFHVNPYLAKIYGSTEISGSGMTYLFAKKLRKDNVDLSFLAIIGATGDCQNSGEQQSFQGENDAILQDSIQSNKIIVDVEPLLPRTVSLPLGLANSLPNGINLFDNDPQKAIYFLNKIGVKFEDGFRHPRFLPDLSIAEKTKLTSALVQKFISENTNSANSITDFIQNHYLLTQFKEYPEIYDAKDFSTMLNSCGRLNQPSIGIACCVTQSNAIILKGIENSKLYKKKLHEAINWVLEGNKITYLKGINAFDGENVVSETIVGVVCTMLLDSPNFDENKPIVGYALSDNENYKVSARCSKELIQKGIDLSQAIRDTSSILGFKSKGGGHPPAAGALIPKKQIRQFLTQLDKQVRMQLGEDFKTESTSTKSQKSLVKKKGKKTSTKKEQVGIITEDKQPKLKKTSKTKSKGLDHFLG